MNENKDINMENESNLKNDFYSYEEKGKWSAPLRHSVIKAWAESGYLSQGIKLQRMDENYLPVGREELVSDKFELKRKENMLATNAFPINKGKIDAMKNSADIASKALKEFTEALSEEKFMKTIEALLKVSKGLSRVSLGLGVIGAVLGIISIFSNRKSDTQLILEAIDQMGQKINDLEATMLNQFERLINIIGKEHALTQLRGHLNKLVALQKVVINYNGYILKGEIKDQEECKELLLEYKSKEIREAVVAIASQSTGANLADNIFSAIDRTSYGNLSEITDLGSYLYYFASFGLIADTLIQTLKITNDDGEVDIDKAETKAKVANDIYLPLLDSIYESWESSHHKCIKDHKKNWREKVIKEWMLVHNIESPDYQKLSVDLLGILSKQWFWKDWFVLIYDGKRGYHNHSMEGGDYEWWPKDSKNIIVFSISKDREALGSQWDTSYTIGEFNEYLENGKTERGVQYHLIKAKIKVEWPNIEDAFRLMDHPVKDDGFICMLRKGIKYGHTCTNKNRLLYRVGNDSTAKIKIPSPKHGPQAGKKLGSMEYAIFIYH